MTLAELWPALQPLTRAEKLRLVHSLVGELAREEEIRLVEGGGDYPVWSPLEANDAAAVMLRLLEESEPAS